MKTPWTPGPWAVDVKDLETGASSTRIVGAHRGVVALLKFASGKKQHNARLIAAAPKLAELLWQRAQWDEDSPWREEARALLESIGAE
jgi:hypothetical protein